ncbi:MAG: VWA domain-containing protein [Polyangiaceae bacterium]
MISSKTRTIASFLFSLVLLGGCGGYSSRYNGYKLAAIAPSQGGSAMNRAESREEFAHREDNPFQDVKSAPLSTFSVDVDTASYTLVRRMLLQENRLPPPDAVRIEEMINYFQYGYSTPNDSGVGVTIDSTQAPWTSSHKIVRLAVKAKELAPSQVGPRNLVFLLDVSGSMMPPNRLPLVQRAMRMLVDQLNEQDTVSIVTYAGSSGVALPPTSGDKKGEIRAAINELHASGGTNGSAGIQLAYQTARKSFKTGGVNRVILATDGDFNLGQTSESDLLSLIESERKSNVFLTVLGVGEGNLNDKRMEMLADKGNGNYAYLDNIAEARKVLVQQAGGTLVTVAKDVKIQVEFNPEKVAQYRLIGYENRLLEARDFKDDNKDAGDMGSGHEVTALYEIVPKNQTPLVATPGVDPLKYQTVSSSPAASSTNEWMTVKIRHKEPDGAQSQERVYTYSGIDKPQDPSLTLALAVAELGMMLRKSPARGEATYEQVLAQLDSLEKSRGIASGQIAELRTLVEKARTLSGGNSVQKAQ